MYFHGNPTCRKLLWQPFEENSMDKPLSLAIINPNHSYILILQSCIFMVTPHAGSYYGNHLRKTLWKLYPWQPNLSKAWQAIAMVTPIATPVSAYLRTPPLLN